MKLLKKIEGKMKKIIRLIILILIFHNFFLFSEKWVGKAATYQKKIGTKTISGIEFNDNSEFAACNAFKIGTKVKIRNIKTNKIIETVINDRIEETVDYFILLTPKLAKELGIEWQTATVIVEATFNDIETEQKLEITGLIPEDKIDKEILKKFPDIQFNFVKEISKETRIEIEKKNGKEERKITETPLGKKEEQTYKEERIEKEAKLANDEKILSSPLLSTIKPEKKNIKTLEKEEKNLLLTDDFVIKEISYPKYEKKEIIELPKEKIPSSEKEVISWNNSLIKDKSYIRLSTTFDQKEAERRVKLFKEIFNTLVWIKAGNSYILLIGPFNKEDLNKELDFVRSLGFIDAYIIKGN